MDIFIFCEIHLFFIVCACNIIYMWMTLLMFCCGGEVTEIKYNEAHDSWNSKIVGKDIEGPKLFFVAEVFEIWHTVRCITVQIRPVARLQRIAFH